MPTRPRGAAFGIIVALTASIAVGSCRDPTQVTLAISIDPRLACSEISPGTAITVGVDPLQVEQNVDGKSVTTTTTQCDGASHSIGTLVVTPSDTQTGAVAIVVGYAKNPVECRPPFFDGCIVARRRFVFIENTPLRIPVVIDPDCKGVPCDAFSTCSRGRCYPSLIECPDGICGKPGEQPDGAPADEDAAVVPDAPQPPRDAGGDAPADAPPTDAPQDTGVGSTYCDMPGNDLYCSGVLCNGPNNACCVTGGTAMCMVAVTCASGMRKCCKDVDCGPGDGGPTATCPMFVGIPRPTGQCP
jgi:hypothetical protein